MSTIERLVRPFQLPDTAPARPFPTSEQPGSSDNAVLTVTGNGQIPVYQINYSHSVTCYMTKQERETKSRGTSGQTSQGDAFDSVFPSWQKGLL